MKNVLPVLLLSLALIAGCGKIAQMGSENGETGALHINAAYNLNPNGPSIQSLGDNLVTSGNVILTQGDSVYTFPLTIESGVSYVEKSRWEFVGDWAQCARVSW